MFRFWKDRPKNQRETPASVELGHLEQNVMEILWKGAELSVRDVTRDLGRPLAYTTVMTTLDRLFKKGLLARRKADRAFLYSPKLSRTEFERARAGDLVAGFLGGPEHSRELLVSCFLDAVGQHDHDLLEELEKKIRQHRKDLNRRGAR
jgi:predicted transcriptional regulator